MEDDNKKPQRFDPIRGEFVDADTSNEYNPANPKTGEISGADAEGIVGAADEEHPGRFNLGPQFHAKEIQVGAHTTRGVDRLVCKSDGGVYSAWWEIEE